jgi:hypothetical protein
MKMNRQLEPRHAWPLNTDNARAEARSRGYTVFSFPADITSKSAFFDAVRHTLPTSPPLLSTRSWDALSDSLWQGLLDIEAPRIMILWPRADLFASICPADFTLALRVLQDISNTLTDPAATRGKAKAIEILIEHPHEPST